MSSGEFIRLGEARIKDNVGGRLMVSFLARNVDVRPQKGGGDFLVVDMVDKEVVEKARMFGVSEVIKEKVIEGQTYDAIIDIKPFNGSPSCILYTIDKSDKNPSDFVEWVENLEVYEKTIENALNFISKSIYGVVAGKIVDNNWERFKTWPAATSHHHNILGGLMAHTAGVVKSAVKLAEVYNTIYGEGFINLQLLIAGGILHDIKKTTEMNVDLTSGKTEYTTDAALITHIMDLLSEIDAVASELDIKEAEEISLLKHLVASHHGRLEWGSPITPNIPEAVILSQSDFLDAEMYRMNKDIKMIDSGNFLTTWKGGEMKVTYKEMSK